MVKLPKYLLLNYSKAVFDFGWINNKKNREAFAFRFFLSYKKWLYKKCTLNH